jgi:hypothetical protein|nr:MAG TPA: hypothetical protein [Caudoviricetes sp.]
MKYKVGDKVKVRSDLKCEEYYGGITFNFEMNKFKGMEITIARVNYGGYYEVLETPYNFTDEMLEPVEEMSAEEAIRLYAKVCKDNNCYACPVYKKSGECGCEEFAINHPEEVIESLKQWKADHEKKPIETENVTYIVVMDEKRNVVYEEKTNEAIITATMKEEVLKKYCTEHDGKYYAIAERRCVVKE